MRRQTDFVWLSPKKVWYACLGSDARDKISKNVHVETYEDIIFVWVFGLGQTSSDWRQNRSDDRDFAV